LFFINLFSKKVGGIKKMKGLFEKFCFVAFALIALVSAVQAYSNSGMIIDTDNFYFETYEQSNYGYQVTSTPYTYSYNDWLYFDDSFRVNYYGTYYNYPSGWYDFNPSYWYNDPYAYSYYSPNYYYYNNAWNYYPGWTTVYGPQYYSAYYYPSFSNYYSYPLNYYAYPSTYYTYPAQVVAPTYNVGASFNYPQEAVCSQLSISANSVSMNAGDSRNVEVRISNNSTKNFQINSVDVYVDSFDVRSNNVNFDSTIVSGYAGTANFNLDADSDAGTDSFDVDVRVNGQFTDGTRCTGSTVSESFNVFVKAANAPSTATNFVVVPSTSVSTPPRGFVEVTPTPTMSAAPAQTPSAAPPAPSFIEGDCSGIDIVEKNFSVDAGNTITKDVYIKNFSSENFIIDYVTVQESEDSFAATVNKDTTKIYSGDYGKVRLSIAANDVAKEANGSVVLSARGHLENSGKTCTAAAEMLIGVKGETAVFSGGFNLEVPEKIELNGTSGVFQIKAVNTTNETAKVWFETEQGVISPSFIVVPANSTVEKIISVNAFAADSGKIFFRTELPGLAVLDKYSNVVRNDISGISTGNPVVIVNYSSVVEVNNGKAEVSVELLNTTASEKTITATITGLPDGFDSDVVSTALAAGQKKTAIVTVNATNVAAGTYNGKLLVTGNFGSMERNVQIVKNSGNAQAAGISGLLITAFAVLGDNAGMIVLVLVLLVVIYLVIKILQGAPGKNNKPWDTKEPWMIIR
jgi:hypothetical protein